MKLEYKDKSIEVDFVKPTARTRKEIINILKKAPPSKERKILDLQKKLWEYAATNSIEELTMQEAMVKALKENKITKEEFYTLVDENFEDGINQDNTTIELFKVIINRYFLEKEEIKLIDSKPESEFWQNQDILEMENAVNSFRSSIRI